MRVLLADDHSKVRSALRLLLEHEPGLSVVGEVADGVEAIRLAEVLRPDVVLMDVRMPGLDGIEALKRIKRARPEVKVIVLSMYDSHRAEVLEAGADAFISKGNPPERLLAAIADCRPREHGK